MKLTQLANGDWLDLTKVVALQTFMGNPPQKPGWAEVLPNLAVFFFREDGKSQRMTLSFPCHQDMTKYRDQLADEVNKAKEAL